MMSLRLGQAVTWSQHAAQEVQKYCKLQRKVRAKMSQLTAWKNQQRHSCLHVICNGRGMMADPGLMLSIALLPQLTLKSVFCLLCSQAACCCAVRWGECCTCVRHTRPHIPDVGVPVAFRDSWQAALCICSDHWFIASLWKSPLFYFRLNSHNKSADGTLSKVTHLMWEGGGG